MLFSSLNKGRLVFRIRFATKLALTMTTLILLAAILIGYPMVYRLFSMMEEQFETIGLAISKQAARSAVQPIFENDDFGIERLVNSVLEQELVVAVVLINKDFDIFGTSYPRPTNELLQSSEYFRTPNIINDENNISWFTHPIEYERTSDEPVSGGVVWLGLNKGPLISNQQLVASSAVTVVALFVLAIIWLAVRLSRNLSKPISELIEATHAIALGHFHYRIENNLTGEFADVKKSFNDMAQGLEEKLTLEKNISRFVSGPVANNYMSKNESELSLKGERVEASILFVDLVKYTSFSQQHPPETVADVLNLYFSEFSMACHQFNGNVDKFIGDCAMLVFGCPASDELHREHALECALHIRNRIHELNAERRIQHLPWLDIRIGLAGGTVLAGLLGSSERLNYSVVGEAANLAARLCDKAPCGEILIDREFLKSLGHRPDLRIHETQRLTVKGFSQPIDTLVVEDISKDIDGAQS
jgi:adenylate cyclase